jgi:hypothetical protein
LGAFWLQTGNRLLGVLSRTPVPGGEQAFLKSSWLASVLLYVLGCFLTSFLPMPAFGITRGVIAGLRLPGTGLWISEPYRVIAFGFLYYAGTGWWELVAPGRLARRATGGS